jgi:hypothetical protein
MISFLEIENQRVVTATIGIEKNSAQQSWMSDYW